MIARYLRDFGSAILLAVPTLALARPDAPPPITAQSAQAAEIVTARDAYDDRYFRMRQSPFG
jgi:hypothetical protein